MPQIPMPYTVHLDHTMRVTPLSTLFAKGDSAAHRFELTILRAGVQEDLSGCTVMCKFYRMADSAVVSVPGSVEGGKAVAVLDAACYDYIGRFALTISIKKGEEETTVFYGDGYMHGQRADTAISGEYIIYDINTLLEKIAEIDAATQAANTATSNANTATANANTATGKANTAASAANTAAANANTAKDTANAAAAKIDNMTVSATPVETGTATAALSTVDGHYHLALGLPKGDTGATPQISVQVQTGAAGSEASVSVSGTAENPVIHLTIPRGDVGAIENLTINGKPVESGTITLTAADLGAASAESVNQLKDDMSEKLGKTETAADSAKLGGKAPEYYLQPRNLLDNSDFTNPINQRGNSEYTFNFGYSLDRWRLYGGNSVSSVRVLSDCIELSLNDNKSYFDQLIDVDKTKIYTFAVLADDGLHIISGIPSVGANDGVISLDVNSAGYVRASVVGFLRVYNIYWAALYEGSYTAETLPPYVPKGYAAELAECQRYYVKIKSGTNFVFRARNAHSANYYSAWEICPPIIFPKPMRVKPSVEISYDLNDGVNTIGTPFDWSNQSCTMPDVSVPPGEWFDCNYVIASANL